MKYTALLSGLLLAIAAFTSSSCSEDSLSQIVEIEIPEHTPKPVIASYLNYGDTLALSLVSVSKGILDTGDYVFPANASVRLLRDGQDLLSLAFNPDKQHYEAPAPASGFIPGARYRIEAQVPGFGTAYSEQVMPTAPNVAEVLLRRDAVVNRDGSRADEFVFSIDDPAGSGNYYKVEVLADASYSPEPGDTTTFLYPLFLHSNDPNLQSGLSNSKVFSDGSFDGTLYQIRVSANSYSGPFLNFSDHYTLRIAQISRDAYLYERTLSQYYNARGNPFAEPVTVYSNIEGGYGIFRAAHWKEWELR
jgi:hypothetical protein